MIYLNKDIVFSKIYIVNSEYYFRIVENIKILLDFIMESLHTKEDLLNQVVFYGKAKKENKISNIMMDYGKIMEKVFAFIKIFQNIKVSLKILNWKELEIFTVFLVRNIQDNIKNLYLMDMEYINMRIMMSMKEIL